MTEYNKKGVYDKLIPLLKAINKGDKPHINIVRKFPEFFDGLLPSEEGKQFLKRCLGLFPFLEKHLK